jgi:hypothetical protein
MSAIRPFTLDVPQAELDDLNARIDLTRWPEKEPVDDWSQGTPLVVLEDLMAYWRNDYDWRRCEARLNALGQFITEIDGLDIINEDNTIVFHAGTAQEGKKLVTQGGRVLAVTSFGATVRKAAQRSLKILEFIDFQDIYYRKDIGYEFE